jgi:hypothetical protein
MDFRNSPLKSRKDISEYILNLEIQFPVNDWLFNSVHIWPYVRIQLFLFLINKIETKCENNDITSSYVHDNTKINFIKKTYIYLSIIYDSIKHILFLAALKKKKFLFVGADSHRVDFKGFRYNRYFDTLIDTYDLKKSSYFLEYGRVTDKNKIYNNPNLLILDRCFSNYLSYLKFKKKFLKNVTPDIFSLNGYDNFIKFIGSHDLLKDFALQFNSDRIQEKYHADWNTYFNFFTKTLKYINPDKVMILCYYDFQMMALVAACNSLNIPTIEMQHGPQPETHLSYGSWYNMPDKGYLVMPKYFWNWDENSKANIDKWSGGKKKVVSLLYGNPWINYWIKFSNEKHEKNIILYSLQPSPVNIDQLFSHSIINLIKQSSYIWYIRLHPRQMNEHYKIKSLLLQHNILEKVNINEACTEPLPVLLSQSLVHVTHFSGSAIESNLLGVYNIFLNEIANLYYSEYILKEEAIVLNPIEENFINLFNEKIESLRFRKNTPNFNQIDLNDFFRNV